MADLQIQFTKFNDIIRISYDEDSKLREKRDMLLSELREALKKKFVELGIKVPTFDFFNQGSYYMRTGIKPLVSEDHDIDVGIQFRFSKNDYLPTKVKEWVYEALKTGARTVEYKRSCIRAQYHKAGEKAYHVDIAVYVHPDNNGNTNYIAKGYVGSKEEYKKWEVSDPHKLKDLFDTKISDNTDREQFRRVIRYLKRWKDYTFSSSGTERPTGIALTALCYNLFTVEKDYIKNPITGAYGYKYHDLRALTKVVNGIIGSFNWSNKLTVQLPVKPNNNLCEKMSDNQMLNFKTKLQSFKAVLESASNDVLISTACGKLVKVFGGGFPTS